MYYVLRITTEPLDVSGVHSSLHQLLSTSSSWPGMVGMVQNRQIHWLCTGLSAGKPHLHPTHQCTVLNTISKHYFLRLEITGFPWALIYHLTSFLFNLSLQSLFHSMKWYPETPYFSFWGKPTKIIFCLDVMENACNFLKQLSENNILLIENSQ